MARRIRLFVLGSLGLCLGLPAVAGTACGLLLRSQRGLSGASTARGCRVAMPSGDDAALITPLTLTPGGNHRGRGHQKHRHDDGDDQPAGYQDCHSRTLLQPARFHAGDDGRRPSVVPGLPRGGRMVGPGADWRKPALIASQ